MKTKNEQLFDNLDEKHYISAIDAVVEYRVFKRQFEDVLGYDEKTDGFVALQKGHQPGALFDELPIVSVLKNYGHAVVLTDESGTGKHVDCTIDDIPSEIKLVVTFTLRSFKEDFYSAYKKNAKRIVLKILDDFVREDLIIILKRIAYNPLVNHVNDVFLIINDKLEKCHLSDFK
jgi:hypothetical protein